MSVQHHWMGSSAHIEVRLEVSLIQQSPFPDHLNYRKISRKVYPSDSPEEESDGISRFSAFFDCLETVTHHSIQGNERRVGRSSDEAVFAVEFDKVFCGAVVPGKSSESLIKLVFKEETFFKSNFV